MKKQISEMSSFVGVWKFTLNREDGPVQPSIYIPPEKWNYCRICMDKGLDINAVDHVTAIRQLVLFIGFFDAKRGDTITFKAPNDEEEDVTHLFREHETT